MVVAVGRGGRLYLWYLGRSAPPRLPQPLRGRLSDNRGGTFPVIRPPRGLRRVCAVRL